MCVEGALVRSPEISPSLAGLSPPRASVSISGLLALLLCVPWLISLMATEGSEPAVITGEKKGLLVLRRKFRMLMTVFF